MLARQQNAGESSYDKNSIKFELSKINVENLDPSPVPLKMNKPILEKKVSWKNRRSSVDNPRIIENHAKTLNATIKMSKQSHKYMMKKGDLML